MQMNEATRRAWVSVALLVGALSIGRAETNGLAGADGEGLPADAALQAQLFPPIPAGTEREIGMLAEALAELTPSQRDEVGALLEEYFVEEMRTFRHMLYDTQANPRAYLVRLTGEASRLVRIRAQDPKLYRDLLRQKELQRQAAALARLVMRSQGQSRATRREELERILSAEFDIRQRLMTREVAGLEAELTNLKTLLERRKTRRDEIIRHRADGLTGEGRDLDW